MQWEITIPPSQLIFQDNSTSVGRAAQAAAKAVNCAVKAKTTAAHTIICILYGGQEPIHNGVVAQVQLVIAPDAHPGSERIRVAQGLAVSKDLKKVMLDPAEAVVEIRAK